MTARPECRFQSDSSNRWYSASRRRVCEDGRCRLRDLASPPSWYLRFRRPGGSPGWVRVQGTHRPEATGTCVCTTCGEFDSGCLRAKDWPGRVSDCCWLGPLSGGAWLTLDSRAWVFTIGTLEQCRALVRRSDGRTIQKELLFSYAAGIPVYVVGGELAVIPGPCREVAPSDLSSSLASEADVAGALTRCSVSAMPTAVDRGTDPAVVMAYASRRLIEAGPIRLGLPTSVDAQREGHCRSRRPCRLCGPLLQAHDDRSLGAALTEITAHVTRLTVPSTDRRATEQSSLQAVAGRIRLVVHE